MLSMIRPTWRGNAGQEQLLRDAVEAVHRARAEEDAAWDAIKRARDGGVPDTVLCRRTEVSRATLNRKLGARSDGSEEQIHAVQPQPEQAGQDIDRR